MSANIDPERFGYDGHFIYGHIQVNYWQDRETVLADIDRQTAEIREAALESLPRLTGRLEP